jgi:hypothetical protein
VSCAGRPHISIGRYTVEPSCEPRCSRLWIMLTRRLEHGNGGGERAAVFLVDWRFI